MSFDGLPLELRVAIAEWLPVADWLRLERVSREWVASAARFLSSVELGRRLVMRLFCHAKNNMLRWRHEAHWAGTETDHKQPFGEAARRFAGNMIRRLAAGHGAPVREPIATWGVSQIFNAIAIFTFGKIDAISSDIAVWCCRALPQVLPTNDPALVRFLAGPTKYPPTAEYLAVLAPHTAKPITAAVVAEIQANLGEESLGRAIWPIYPKYKICVALGCSSPILSEWAFLVGLAPERDMARLMQSFPCRYCAAGQRLVQVADEHGQRPVHPDDFPPEIAEAAAPLIREALGLAP
jgi:hypothetical protein